MGIFRGRPQTRSCPYSGCTHRCQGDDKQLAFRDPETFIAGEIHNHHEVWTNLTYLLDNKQLIMDWITNGVSISPYIRHFKGVFKGISYDHEFPPGRVFQNHPSCQQFGKFISSTLESRLETVNRNQDTTHDYEKTEILTGFTVPFESKIFTNVRLLINNLAIRFEVMMHNL